MKKLMLTMVMITMGIGLAFADFEFQFGFYGGYGNTASVGLNTRLGFITPAYKGAVGGEERNFRWALLTDFGVGFRYGMLNKTYEVQEPTNWGGYQTVEKNYSDVVDYNIGLITEFYFLRPMGFAIGGGVAPGALNEHFIPYVRAEIPFLFENAKLTIGYDQVLWGEKEVPQGVTMPLGYRINLLLHLRGDLAFDLFRFWFGF